ncbi:MAG: DNA polymerase [Candidatus Dojkabacteria bacterium]|nr:DNA polymerase [Candidatus Dojkabacteria bacterium]
MKKFCGCLYSIKNFLDDIINKFPDVPKLTEEEEKRHKEAKICEGCLQEFTNENPKCIHHDHETGKYLGAYCKICNLKLHYNNFYKYRIFFHNFKGYDSHFIVKLAMKILKVKENEQFIIGSSSEQFSFIKTKDFIFMDTMQHLKTSLEKLVESTPKEEFIYFKKLKLPEILMRKGVYPYEWIDDYSKFENKELPPKECFYNSLKNSHISDSEYEHAKKVWNELKCEKFLDYHIAYLKSDVVLLADCFESYRRLSKRIYGLDPALFVSAPSLSWNAFLKFTQSKIQTFEDSENDKQILKIIIDNMRGGICSRGELIYANTVDKKDETILYFDMVNLYGRAMLCPLPIENYKIFEPTDDIEQIKKFVLHYNFEKNENGYILICDIDVPDNKDFFKGYPLFPEKINKKLEGTLLPKKNYAVHICHLKLGLELGYKLINVHKIIKFTQKPIMKDYILFNTEQRKKSTSEYYENFFKLLNNSIYGKTCENPLKYRTRKILTSHNEIVKFLNGNSCYDFHWIDDGVLLGEYSKQVEYNKPIIIGFVVLELSKMFMGDFYYNVMKKHFGDKCKLIYTDTDSLVCHISGSKEPMKELNEKYKDRFEQPETKKVPGKMKLECECIFFGAYAPKHYFYVTKDLKTNFKMKGVPKECIDKDGFFKPKTIDDIKKFEEEFLAKMGLDKIFEFNHIISKNHQICVKTEIKRISHKDTKREVINEKETVPKGYNN